MTIRRIPFTVLPFADDTFRCTRCGARLRKGERGVALRQEGAVEFQHAEECPPLIAPMEHPEARVIQAPAGYEHRPREAARLGFGKKKP